MCITPVLPGLVAGPWVGRAAVGLLVPGGPCSLSGTAASTQGVLLGWTHTWCGFQKKECKLEGNWSSAGYPHSRVGVVIGTFRAFAAAHGHCVQTGFGSEQKVMRPGIAAINLLSAGSSNFTRDSSVAVLHLCPSLNLTKLPRLPRQGCSCPWHRRCPEDQMSPACTYSPGGPKFPVFVPSFCAAMLSPGLEPCGKEGG